MKAQLTTLFFRFAAGGWLPARWFEPELPPLQLRAAREGRLRIEIVSHCWRYAHFLVYQLSSLVLFPPRDADVTMTVFHSPEDADTTRLLEFFSAQSVPGVRWNWRALPRERLFRRGIGRNLAALETTADWIWFTDCDLMFRGGCLDSLAALLQNRRDALVYPQEERCTDLLDDDNPILLSGASGGAVVDIDASAFSVRHPTRATGPLQIVHGDVSRAVGYCRNIRIYQTPSPVWCKAHEDRAFRWLLGTQGVPLPIPGVYRIRHVHKGRYTGSAGGNRLRSRIRLLQSQWRDRKR